MNENCIWIPDCEYIDKHVVLSKKNLECYLNLLTHIQDGSYENVSDKKINKMPCVMYSNVHKDKSEYYKNVFEKSGKKIDDFYKHLYKKQLICELPGWQPYAGFFTYPLFVINSILYCKKHSDHYFDLPIVNFDNHLNRYIDNDGIFWNNYFTIKGNYTYKHLGRKMSDGELDNLHHHFGIQTYPYGRGMYKNHREYYDKPYNNIIDDFYLNNRITANTIITQYLTVNDMIVKKVNDFFEAKLSKYYVIGIHIRGTDKQHNIGGRKILPHEYFKYIDYLLNKHDNSILFLATDDETCNTIMKEKYQGKLITYDNILRSKNNILYEKLDNNYKKGEDVIIDSLLLSKCNFLLYQSSAVSEFAIYFNTKLHYNGLNLQYDNSRFIE
jgi:hypothetical protein